MANDLHGIVNGMADDGRKLLAELPDGSTVRAQAEQSLQSANRAGQLVRHLLRLSEREARATTGSDPNSLVRANEPMLRQLAGPDIDLRFELAPSLPPVECDADELAGLLSTLVVTVRGALPLGGSIRVTTQPPRKDGGRRRNDTSLALAVIAEGYGMVSVPTTVCDEVVTRSGGDVRRPGRPEGRHDHLHGLPAGRSVSGRRRRHQHRLARRSPRAGCRRARRSAGEAAGPRRSRGCRGGS